MNQKLMIMMFTNVFPNPFKSEVNITFTLQDPQYVRIWIMDSKGQVVDELENSLLLSGSFYYQWSGLNKQY